jgi:hypothetical protein
MSAVFDENNNIISGTLNIGSGNIYDIILSDTSGSPTIFNQNRSNIDFAVSGMVVGDVMYFDVSKGRLGVNVTNPDATLHVVTDCANDGLKVESETNCATGVRILFVHNSQTPPETGSYPVTIDLAGRDNNYATINYGQIKSRILNPASQQTSGELIFTVDHTGVNREIFRSSLVNTVLGGLNSPTGHFYDILGFNNTSSGLSYIILGNNNTTIQNTGIIVGNNIVASGNKILVFANDSKISGMRNIVFALDSTISGLYNIAFGTDILTTGTHNIIIGQDTKVKGNNFVGLTSEANISGESVIGFGVGASVIGNDNIYVGSNISISGSNDIAIGSNINLSGSQNIVYGNQSDVSGNSIISIGRDNNPQGINTGIYIGNDISLTGSKNSMILGLGVKTTSGLNDSILIGINNSTLNAAPDSLVLVGQNNTVSQITESLIVGNDNNLSGNIANNIVIGPRNRVPTNSNNNLIVGVLNNTSGIVISTDGSIVGTDQKTAGTAMANTTVFGINNWVSNASGALVFGNKIRVSGLNNNNLGSYTNLNGDDIQNFGNSNFVVGDNNVALGSKNDILGNYSVSVNTSNTKRNQLFGNNNIVIGNNEVVVSGMSIGFDNEIYGVNNLVYGKNNTLGLVRYPCMVSGTNVVIVGDITAFNGGDRVLVGLYSPASQDTPVFVRSILDGTDPITEEPLGILKENLGSNFTTTLVVDSAISSTNTVEYYVKNTFDDIIHGQNPCSECFSNLFSGYSSGYVVAYQNGNDEDDLINNPRYGNTNIILGDNNKHTHSSGLVIGYRNTVSGVNHLVIGNSISGYFNNTVQIGTNNRNKLVFNNNAIIFNTGLFQTNVYFNSAAPGNGNDARALYIDLSNNRVGINTTSPRSTLDVSGTLTTQNLRVGLGTVAGYTLHADANGNATWDLPVNLSGQNSGLLFMVNQDVGSGIRELIFNTGTRELAYLRADRDLQNDFNLVPGSVEEKALIINQQGLYLNNSASDWGYQFVLKGSGIQDEVNGDNSIYLIKTEIKDNAIRIHNVTGVSGIFQQMKVINGLDLPVNLTGTVLRVNNVGNLRSQSFDRHSVLFTSSNYASTGNNALRYYADSQAITIGTTGEPPLQANVSLVQGASNTYNNIILGSSNGVNTVFNNAGAGGNRFIVVGSGQAGTKKGLQYDANTGALGVNVDTVDANWKVSSTSDAKYWFEAGKLVVDGKLRASSLQLTANGKDLAGDNSVNKYLKVTDAAGNIGLDTLDLQYQFSGIHPLRVTTDSQNEIVTVRLDTRNANQVSLGSTDNGLILSWDGSKWVQARGLRVVQPADGGSTDATAGLEFGNALSLNSCYNNHVFGGGSFASPGNANFDRMRGSSQLNKFYLRGRTLADGTSELLSNWHKDTSATAAINNTISLQYTTEDNGESVTDHNRSLVWNYTINYSAIFNNGTANGFGAVAGEVKGAVLSYRNSDGSRTTTKLGSESHPQKRYTGVDYSATDPITVTIQNAGDNANVQRLAIIANGRPSYNGLWSVTVDINQVFMPSGVNFGNSDT